MQIDLNNPEEFTFENVRELLASKDDSQSRQLRVSKDGIAYLSDVCGNRETENLHCRLETWCAGNDYTGPNAAADDTWVARIHTVLKANWPNLENGRYIDLF